MVRTATFAATLIYAITVLGSPMPQGAITKIDFTNGDKNLGKAGAQFITGPCDSDGNCASGCCATLTGTTNVGVCSGPGASTQAGKQGCGFKGGNGAAGATGAATSTVSSAAGAATAGASDKAGASGGGAITKIDFTNGAKNLGKSGAQFITGPCDSDGNCASGCCATLTGTTNVGVCSGPGASTQAGKQGCGFKGGNGAAAAAGATSSTASAAAGTSTANAGTSNAAASTGAITKIDFTNGGKNLGKAGAQFITGPCDSDGNCASGCCAFLTGSVDVGVCSGPGAKDQAGKLGCGFSKAAAPAKVGASASGSADSATNAAAASSESGSSDSSNSGSSDSSNSGSSDSSSSGSSDSSSSSSDSSNSGSSDSSSSSSSCSGASSSD